MQSEANKNIKQAKIEAEANAERTAIKKAQEERRLVESKTAGQAYEKFNTRIDDDLYKYIVDLGKRLNQERASQ